ncbi:MAG TPA: three-Cys-motif partner protein TcmP [Longimicrobium sp.]|nr:three-Cys-motif partner protein TcmP [Longimicrobium sp.]
MSIKDRLPVLAADGLVTPDVGEWAYKKYFRVWLYNQMFTTGMKNRWFRVYIDLFAGAGRSLLRDSRRIVPNAAILALDLRDRYDRYVFCEKDPERIGALRERVGRVAPGADVRYVLGDSNETTSEIATHVPADALTFCFADPYGVNLRLETIRRLSAGRNVDFLILLALQMDANRNRERYAREESRRLEDFLGNARWRTAWEEAERRGEDFRMFLADQYIAAMRSLGYARTTRADLYQMRTEVRNLSIYYLAFFSKHALGYRFWREALKYSDKQTSMLDGLGI